MNMGCCNGGYHEFNLDWFIKRFNEIQADWDGTKEWLKNWVDSFDISGEVKKVMQEWVDDGTFENLINQEVFGDINKKVDQNTADISALETRVNQAETDIAGNKTAIQAVDTRVKTLENRRKNKLGSKIVMIADSYGEYGCMENFANVISATIAESKWVGGAGFTQSGSQSFLTILNSLPDHNDVDYVVVFGFYNDAWDTVNLGAKILEFKNRALVKYPGSELVLINQGWSSNYELQGYFQALMNELYKLGSADTHLINTWKYLHNYNYMQSDKIHPTAQAGAKQGIIAGRGFLGENIESIGPITGNEAEIINGWEAWGSTLSLFEEMNDSECILYFTNDINHFGLHTGGTLIECNGHNLIELMILKPGYIIGSGDIQETVPCIIQELNGGYYQGMCTLEIQDRTLKVRPILLNKDGSSYMTLTMSSIQWGRCTLRGNIYHI